MGRPELYPSTIESVARQEHLLPPEFIRWLAITGVETGQIDSQDQYIVFQTNENLETLAYTLDLMVEEEKDLEPTFSYFYTGYRDLGEAMERTREINRQSNESRELDHMLHAYLFDVNGALVGPKRK